MELLAFLFMAAILVLVLVGLAWFMQAVSQIRTNTRDAVREARLQTAILGRLANLQPDEIVEMSAGTTNWERRS